MSKPKMYSNILHCVYDEPHETGNIGRGSHYSVFRVPEWFDVTGAPVKQALQHDFAVIWDEDHDTRIIQVIERLYLAGLLFPVQFIGERKGGVSVILSAKSLGYCHGNGADNYTAKVEEIVGDVPDDYWPTEFGMFDKSLGSPHQTDFVGMIADNSQKVDTYMRNIDNLWTIGSWQRMKSNVDIEIQDLI